MTAVETRVETKSPVHHKTVRIDNQDIFYREAGPQNAPVIHALAWIPNLVQYVPQPNSPPGRLVSISGA
jgi:hypothetical protein